jgi:hypothetical protein
LLLPRHPKLDPSCRCFCPGAQSSTPSSDGDGRSGEPREIGEVEKEKRKHYHPMTSKSHMSDENSELGLLLELSPKVDLRKVEASPYKTK